MAGLPPAIERNRILLLEGEGPIDSECKVERVACPSKVLIPPKPQRSNYQLAWGMGRYGYCTSY